MQEPLAHTIKSACEVTGLGRSSIYEAIQAGKLKALKYGNRTLILHEDLKRFIESLPVAA